MPRGRPDFFGTPIHPEYGVFKHDAHNLMCAGGVWSTVHTLVANGMLLHGYFFSTDTDANKDDTFDLTVDGEDLMANTFSNMVKHGCVVSDDSILIVSEYDTITPGFYAHYKGGFSFHDNIILKYLPAGVNNVLVFSHVFYYTWE